MNSDAQASARAPRSAPPWLFGWAAVLSVLALLFGGASRENALQVAALELAALPLLILGLWRLARGRRRAQGAVAVVGLFGLIAAVPAIQLIPLPASIWTVLPEHKAIADILAAAGLPPGVRPASLTPVLTARSLLALVPPAAMAVACVQMDVAQQRRLAWIWAGGALAGLAIGIAQLAMGPDSPLYFYATTNLGSSVGLFSNRNHHASLLLGAMPFVAALTPVASRRSGGGAGAEVLAGLVLLLMAGAVVAVQSRAAILLLAPVLAAVAALAWRTRRGRTGPWGRVAALATLGAAAVLTVVIALSPALARFTTAPSEDARYAAWPTVFAVLGAHQPLGAGIGAFDVAYRAAEPLDQVGPIYLNHAHNDYLELGLEAGWMAAAVFAVFLVWFLRRGLAVWRGVTPGHGALAAAAWIAAATALAHSAVDYPLRTLTMATFFAYCCALVATARVRASGD